MKINKFESLLLLGAALLATSCSGDFLDTEPTNRVSGEKQNEILLDSPEKINAVISGAYTTVFSGTPYISDIDDRCMTSYMLVMDMLGDDMANFLNGGTYAFDQQLIFREPGYRRPSNMWRQFYYIISSVNSVMGTLLEGEGTSDEIDAMLGQALALRGWAYYWLINMWQHPYDANPDAPGVPIYMEDATKNILSRASVKEVYAVIDADLSKACELLKGKELGNTVINEYAASGIYANVLMFLGRYEEAAAKAEYATQGGTLATPDQLLSGFNSLSMPEVLWGFQVTDEWNMIYASFMSMINPYVDGYAVPGYYPKLGASALVDNIDPNDVRKDWFGYKEALITDPSAISFKSIITAGFEDYVPNKFLCPSTFKADLIYMRVAEMYFVAAEAYYLANDETKARKALTDVMSTRIPGYDASGKSGDALYQEICFQKRVEMWGEGCRLFDAKRRNETFDRSKSKNFPAALASANAVTYSARDYRMIYKIPTIEMENNENITDEDQNP